MKSETKRIGAAAAAEYLEALTEDKRTALKRLRHIIRSIAPNSDEVISYQVPTFNYKGGLVAFAAFKDHCSLFVMSSTLLSDFKEDLKGFKIATGTIQFTPDKPLPESLIRKIVEARMKENEARISAKTVSMFR